jgi:hypothetical protein
MTVTTKRAEYGKIVTSSAANGLATGKVRFMVK